MAFVGSIGLAANSVLPGARTPKNPATACKANDQARALMVEADAVLAQEVALSGTLRLWLALVSHAQASQRDTGKKPAVPSGKIPQGPEASTNRRC
jgi:hypothetical protein